MARLPLEYRADILSCLDRFSLDCAAFTCPKLRATVATLDGQNLRDLSRVEVIGVAWGEKVGLIPGSTNHMRDVSRIFRSEGCHYPVRGKVNGPKTSEN